MFNMQLDSLECLFTSDILIDKDLGLIRLIEQQFTNCDDYFYKEIIKHITENPDVGKYLLYNRTELNPLTIISKENIEIEVLDSLYNQFIEKYNDLIVDLAEPTDLMELIRKAYYTSGVVNIRVVCKSIHEEEALKTYFDAFDINLKTIIADYKDVDLDEYDSICIKNFADVLSFKKLHGKTVIISGAEYNYCSIPEYNYHSLDPRLSIYIRNTDNELSKIDMYRTIEIDNEFIEKMKKEQEEGE